MSDKQDFPRGASCWEATMLKAKKTAPFGQSCTINPFPRPLLLCVCQSNPNGLLEFTKEVLVSKVKWIIIVIIGNDNKVILLNH